MNHDQMEEGILALVCGSESVCDTAAFESHAAECPLCHSWKAGLEALTARLRDQARPVPAQLEQSIGELLKRGLPEDPWRILWEAADELARGLRFRTSPRPHRPSADALQREAAEIQELEEVPSLETLVRDRCGQVTIIKGTGESAAYLAEIGPFSCFGVALDAAGVPLAGMEATWITRDGQASGCRTDLRGVFHFPATGSQLASVRFGPPVGVEHRLD